MTKPRYRILEDEPIDETTEKINSIPIRQSKTTKYRILEDETPKEEFSESLQLAFPRTVKDIGDLIFEKLRRAPETVPKYYEKAKTEIPGLYSALTKHPWSTLKQEIAGLAESGEGLFNLPHDISEYATKRLHLIPEDVNRKIQMGRMPEGNEINEVFGKPGYPGQAALRGLAKNIQVALPLGNVAKEILPYINPKLPYNALGRNVAPLEKKLLQAEEEHGFAEGQEQTEKNAAVSQHGVGNQYLLEYRKNEALKKLNNLHSELTTNPPKTLDEHLKANNDLAKMQQEYNEAKTDLDNAKAGSTSEIGISEPNKIQFRINEKQKKLNQLTNDIKNGKPVSEEQLTNARNELDSAKNEFEQNKNYAESTFGTSNQNSLQLKINNNTNKINELNQQLADQKSVKQVDQQKFPNLSEYAETEKRAEAYHDNAKRTVDKVENEIAQHLNIGANHALRASTEMQHEITSINKYWSDAYKNLMQKLKSSLISNWQMQIDCLISKLKLIS